MIRSRADLLEYLEADRAGLRRSRRRPKFFGDEIWKFQRSLRHVEYYTNCAPRFLGKIWRMFYAYRLHRLSLQCGFSIPGNVFGPGLAIAHRGTIVVHSRVRVGAGCRLHTSVNIGASGGDGLAVPTIGANSYIGPGAKIFGKIEIADNIVIGANAVVNRSFLEPGITIAGVPARQIGQKQPGAGSSTLSKRTSAG